MSPSTEAPLTLHLSVGPALIAFAVDRHDLSRTEVGRVVLAAPIQYVWPHPTRSLLYVASSNRSISKADDVHSLATVEVDERTGALRVIGQVDLPTRPIHLTVEPSGLRLFVAYNVPSLVTVHAIRPDGRATQATPQASPLS